MRKAMRKLASIVLGVGLLVAGAQAAFAAECSEGTKVSDTCLGYTYEGCCGANEETYWCDDPVAGPTCMIACADSSTFCGWKDGFYGCAEATSEDPTGTFPYSCVTCDPACTAGQFCNAGTCEACSCGAKECGTDQCGASCGTCAAGEYCTAQSLCEVPPQCVELETAVCDDVKIGDTTGGTSLFDTWECAQYDESGPEAAYKFVATVDDTLLIKLEPGDFDIFVTENLCSTQTCAATGYGSLSFPVVAGTTYWIVVEGYNGYVGPYELTVGCQSTCVPNCTDKTCGDDGCGGTCGECASGICFNDICYDTDGCVAKEDGSAGCPGCACEACVCALDSYCCATAWDSTCQGECLNDCQGCGMLAECGNGKCLGAENCENCAADCGCGVGSVCQTGGFCCTPECTDKTCGDDGCGGVCGTCGENEVCNDLQQCEVCFPSCDGKVCGSNGCEGTCGTCDDGFACTLEGQCVKSYFECKGNSEPSADDCMGATYEGCCDEAGRLVWCQDEKLYCVDCSGGGVTCGWNAEGPYYDCSQEGEDPSGTFPLTCDLQICDPACPAGQICQAGICVDCTSDCTGKECGDDGCGGSCGTCADNETCSGEGQCVDAGTFTECLGNSAPSAASCGDVSDVGCCDSQGRLLFCQEGALYCIECAQAGDGTQCGWSPESGWYDCGTDGAEDPSGTNPLTCPEAICEPDCEGKVCGDDGCGGDCGTCGTGETCEAGACIPGVCVPACGTNVCGDDGCGGSCGTCTEGNVCTNGACVVVCQPVCEGKSCGDDGCGGTCGTCLNGETCNAGVCEKVVVQDVVSEVDVNGQEDAQANDTLGPGEDTGTSTGGGSSGGCAATTNGSTGAALLMALMLLALACVRAYRKN